jgi:methionine aminopeptidase
MIENVGDKFNLDTYMDARKVAMKATLLFAQHVNVGMNLEDMEGLLEETFRLLKIEKKWHMSKIRIGSDTIKSFKDKSNPDISLKKNDIFFIDIGPVINNHEADFGMTFTKGNNPDYAKLQKASRDLFNQAKEYWSKTGATGEELYRFLKEETEKMGYTLDPKMDGHRLGDFPHHVHYKGGLSEVDSKPIENLWVLEVHILDKSNHVGAFYEDILF